MPRPTTVAASLTPDVILSADFVLPRKTESSEGSMYFKNRSKTLYTGISSDPLERVPE